MPLLAQTLLLFGLAFVIGLGVAAMIWEAVMIALIGFYWYGLVIALGIGLMTGWWLWAYRAPDAPLELGPDHELIDWSSEPGIPRLDLGAEREEGDAPPEEAAPVEQAIAANDVAPPPIDLLGPLIAATRPKVRQVPSAVAPEPARAPDDLMIIKGIGAQVDALLRSLGVQRFEDIAAWMPEDIERIDAELGVFKGSILRDEWIGQARLLARGDMEAFTQRYGHLP